MKKLLQAKTFIIPAMRAGLCEYSDERVLVSNDTLAAMAKTSFGIPLIMPEHVELEELKNNLEKYLCGRVADMHYDEEADLWMAHCVADTQEALELFEKGWGVSTSYQVDKKGTGGTLNAVEYNAEILEGTYLHLAIVEHPRYEMAKNPTFYNSKELTHKSASSSIETNTPQKGVSSMKFFRTKREEVKENASDLEIEIDGEKVSIQTLTNAYKASKKNDEELGKEPGKDEKKKEENKKNEEEDKKKEEENKKNEEEDKKKDNEAEEKMNAEVDKLLKDLEVDDKENESEDDKEKDDKSNDDDSDADDKKNSEAADEKKVEADKKNTRFNSMKAAKDNAVLDNELAGFKTLAERAAVGRTRYGNK